MKTRFSIFRISLTVLITLGAAGSRPVDGCDQYDKHHLPAAAIRSLAGGHFMTQRTRGALVALRYGGQRGTIAGQVVLPSGHQVNTRIRVTLSGFRIASLTVYTDNKGRFSIPGVSDGTFTLDVQAESGPYETVTQEVRVIYGAHPISCRPAQTS